MEKTTYASVEEVPTSEYPAIRFFLARHRVIAMVAGILIFALGVGLGIQMSIPVLHVAALVFGVGIWFVILVAAEVVSLVAETLMPR